MTTELELIEELTFQLNRMVNQHIDLLHSVKALVGVVERLTDRVIALEARGATK
jgi:hypothetical protein